MELLALVQIPLSLQQTPVSASPSTSGSFLHRKYLLGTQAYARCRCGGVSWLTLCVNLARPWCPDIWLNIILAVSVKLLFG